VAVDVNARNARPLVAPDATQLQQVQPPPVAVAANGWTSRIAALVETWWDKKSDPPRHQQAARTGMIDLMSRSLDTIQAQLSRLQLAQDPPDLLIRVPGDVAMFHEYWRGPELIQAGRDAAEKALAAAR
jgi:NTE family protein